MEPKLFLASCSTGYLNRKCAMITFMTFASFGCARLAKKNGRKTEATVEVIDYYDEKTGFSAMQRTTGWHMSIVAAMIAKGDIPAGSVPLELAVPGEAFVREGRKRGFKIKEEILTLGEVEQPHVQLV